MKNKLLLLTLTIFLCLCIDNQKVYAYQNPKVLNDDILILQQTDSNPSVLGYSSLYEKNVNGSYTVTTNVTYAGHIIPPETVIWTETKNSISYTGLLKLTSFYYKEDNTIAIYKDTISS